MRHARPDYDNRIHDTGVIHRIPADEPVFLLRAQDRFAPCLLRLWACLYQTIEGHDPEMLHLTEVQIERMESWQIKHGCKTPDLPKAVSGSQ